MVQRITPFKIKIVPRDGEIEITLHININLDGKIIASADNAEAKVESEEEKEAERMVPDFLSGIQLDFGKKE